MSLHRIEALSDLVDKSPKLSIFWMGIEALYFGDKFLYIAIASTNLISLDDGDGGIGGEEIWGNADGFKQPSHNPLSVIAREGRCTGIVSVAIVFKGGGTPPKSGFFFEEKYIVSFGVKEGCDRASSYPTSDDNEIMYHKVPFQIRVSNPKMTREEASTQLKEKTPFS